MTFNYDEEDNFEETDDFEEVDDFDEDEDLDPEAEDDYLEDEDEPDTVLSLAFRKAVPSEVDDEDEDEEAEAEEAEAENSEAVESADGQGLVAPIDTLPDVDEIEEDDDDDDEDDEDDIDDEDEDDLEFELPTFAFPTVRPVVEHFRPREQSNSAYADAVTAYYEQKDYQQAIEKFDEAIAYEAQRVEDNATESNEIVAKSKYWQAEAHVKLQNRSQAIGIFEELIETCQGHYLVLAAKRRADELNFEDA